MNAYEAALLAWQLKPRTVLPMHYGLWTAEDYRYRGAAPDATPDPNLFAYALSKLNKRARVNKLKVGRIVSLS